MITRQETEKISVSIDTALLAWVEKQCEEQHLNRSRYFNRLIVDAMMKAGFDEKQKKRGQT